MLSVLRRLLVIRLNANISYHKPLTSLLPRCLGYKSEANSIYLPSQMLKYLAIN